MPNLGGFEVVAQLTVGVLNQILRSAWDNNIIPHSVDIPSGTAFGPYQLADGVVNIPRESLNLTMDPPVNGVRITLASEIQVEVANPPVPSARMFAMQASITARVPIGVLPGTIHVAALLNGIPRANVSATLTSGDPIPPITIDLIAEYVHARYEDGTIPPTFSQTGASLPPFTADVFVEIFDDASNPSRRIEVSQPVAGRVKLRIPIHLRLSNITAPGGLTPFSPMGVEARLAITADLISAPGTLTARFSTATVDVEDFAPAPGVEGSNYNANKAGANLFGIDLEAVLKNQIRARGAAIVAALGDQTFNVPTIPQIESFIADQAHAALIGRGDIGLWTPTPPPGGDVTVTSVRPLALADALAFCLNNPAGNTSVIVNFIPPGQSCAIGLDGAKVIQIIRDQINKPEEEGGLGGIPHTFTNVNGHEARLTRLDVSLQNGAIRLEGDVTVIDAIADSIDVDASFSADVGLRWVTNADGTQMLEPFLIGEPDVDLSLLAWILSFLIGFITFGLVGGIIALVLVAVVEGIAERIGGAIVRDEVTGRVRGIGAWPQTLEGIGEVSTSFDNPVLIDPQSVVFQDAYLVTATFASTVIAFAQANGPYTVNAGLPVNFVGGPATPDTTHEWEFGDGSSAVGMVATHTYADDGIYVAKHATNVSQPGGVTTRQFAVVRARNVPPAVNAGPDIVADEGQEIEFVASFTDPEWPDTHRAVFDFGDDSLPVEVGVSETNTPPQSMGTARAKHAYCDNGDYLVTVKVRDDDGGVGVDTLRVTVRNVPPTVDAGEDLFAYVCTPITLRACFTDPGWCDTHTATWDFGDCTPVHPAIVREKHEPPAGIGVAAAIHVYQTCGAFLARCTVTDDDGGVGEDTIIVRVVGVVNRDFEGGFRNRLQGTVANGWEPYVVGAPVGTTAAAGIGGAAFAAEEFVVHGGQRSQRINLAGRGRAGIMQHIGTNRGWDYQVSVWYHLDERGSGTCRLGIDPNGGSDPNAPGIVWSAGNEQRNWAQLAGRVMATGRALTIFVEAISEGQNTAAYIDDVVLLPYPCPLEECVPPEPPRQEAICVDWKEDLKPRRLDDPYEKNGFVFRSQTQLPLHIAVWGPPANQGKLQFPARGLIVTLPCIAGRVTAHVYSGTSQPIRLLALDANGQPVGEASAPGGGNAIHTLDITASGIAALGLFGGGNEGLLIDLCAYCTANRQSSAKC